jgi:hypothetical protein
MGRRDGLVAIVIAVTLLAVAISIVAVVAMPLVLVVVITVSAIFAVHDGIRAPSTAALVPLGPTIEIVMAVPAVQAVVS